MRLFGSSLFVFFIGVALLTSGCGGGASVSGGLGGGGGTGGGTNPPPSTANEWRWMSGNNAISVEGVYGSQGLASTSNFPGGRNGAVGWTDTSGNLWLFGGDGLGSTGASGLLNDLWEFSPNGKTWTWVSGSNTASANGGPITSGVYGTQGVASANNVPGPRETAVSWKDGNGNLWLFGGLGYDSAGHFGLLNDLWEFMPATKEWIWVSGSNTTGVAGSYGTLGMASATNVPGARQGAVSWTDSSGNLWLFGGNGLTTNGQGGGLLNDLWEFEPAMKTWEWVSGSDTANVGGNYGQQGVASASNAPGGREGSVSWMDSSGNLWLYGGNAQNTNYALNDLWKFNITTNEWTWVNGSSGGGGVAAVYGTQGTASASNTPGGLGNAVGWTDSSGNLWLFGGYYQASSQTGPYDVTFNALWKFNITSGEWTWVGGEGGNARGIYGTLGVASATNFPGARMWAVGWTDNSGNFWLFGGDGYGNSDSQTSPEGLNDLWRYQP